MDVHELLAGARTRLGAATGGDSGASLRLDSEVLLRHVLGARSYEVYRTTNPWIAQTAVHDNAGSAD
ncbi:MAG: hypothetical protein RQ826_15210, partial [Xanthomonadales bacterium]|nr:hypothetical protein [Xanthomonadales bacterium]